MKTLGKFDGYSDAEWRQIKSILQALRIDADTKLVGRQRQRLRDALEELGRFYVNASHHRFRTPKDSEQLIRAALAEIEAVLLRFERRRLGDVAMYVPSELWHRACAVLTELQAALSANLLGVLPSRSSSNASKGLRNSYLDELTKVWEQTISPQRAQQKLEVAFLLACAAPVFNRQISKKAIETYLQSTPRTSV